MPGLFLEFANSYKTFHITAKSEEISHVVYFVTLIRSLTGRHAINHVITNVIIEFALQVIIFMVASACLLHNRLIQTLRHFNYTFITTCGKIFKCIRGRIRSTPFKTTMTLKQRNTFITKNDTTIVATTIPFLDTICTMFIMLISFSQFFLQRFFLLS